jgi:Flp pilus assembly protein TadG
VDLVGTTRWLRLSAPSVRQGGCKAALGDNAASVGVDGPVRTGVCARSGDGGIVLRGLPGIRGAASHRAPARDQRGQALIEFALVATIMVLLLAALSQFGLIAERQIGIQNAVREAARRGATQTTATAAAAATNAGWTLGQLETLLGNAQDYRSADAAGMQVCYFTPAAPDDVDPAGNAQVWVTVQLRYAHPLFLPLVNVIVDPLDGATDNALAIGASSTFHVEQAGSNNIGSGACATP